MLFQRFLEDRSASVMPLLALSAIPVVGLIGASVDYSRAAAIQATLQAAADSTSLALAKTASTLLPPLQVKRARIVFAAAAVRTGCRAHVPSKYAFASQVLPPANVHLPFSSGVLRVVGR